MNQYDKFESQELDIDDLVIDPKVRKQLEQVISTARNIAGLKLSDVVLFGSQTDPSRKGNRRDTDVELVFNDFVTNGERDNIVTRVIDQLESFANISFGEGGVHLNPVFKRDLVKPRHPVHAAIKDGISLLKPKLG